MTAEAVRKLVEDYVAAFNEDDFEATFACYRMPFTWLFGARAVTVSTREEFIATMRQSKAGLRANELACSKIADCTVRMLGAHAALASPQVSRVRADGSEIERRGGTYLVHNDGHGWRLVGFAAHPIEDSGSGHHISEHNP